MKKPLVAGIVIIAAYAALCAPVWPRSVTADKSPAVTAKIAEVEQSPLAVPAKALESVAAQPTKPKKTPTCDDIAVIPEEVPAQKSDGESTERPRQTVPATESRAASPKMGDTRTVDGQKASTGPSAATSQTKQFMPRICAKTATKSAVWAAGRLTAAMATSTKWWAS